MRLWWQFRSVHGRSARAARLGARTDQPGLVGQRPSHGYAAHRLLGRAWLARLLPRPVTIGLAGPFARPARTAVTLVAILFGAAAVTFGVGLATSLDRVYNDLAQTPEQVQVNLPGGGIGSIRPQGQDPGPALPSQAAQERAVQSAPRAQPGTLHYVAQADDEISVLGLSDQVDLTGFAGDASWTGYAMISGHWYSGAGEADVNTAFLTDTGAAVGDTYVALKPGVDPQAYARAIGTTAGTRTAFALRAE